MAAAWTKLAVRLLSCSIRGQTPSLLNCSAISRRGLCVHATEEIRKPDESLENVRTEKSLDETLSNETSHSLKHRDYFGVRELVNLKSLFANRVHFGHHKGSRDPYMVPYIFGSRFDYDIINLDQTLPLFQDALNFVAHIAYRNGIILFVSKNRIIMPNVEETAQKVGEYAHCRHWHRGLFTDSSSTFKYVTRLPDICIFLNTLENVFETHQGVIDCAKLLIPSVGIVDTNCDPRLISYPIPGNDDTIQTQLYYLNLFKEAILIGKQKRVEDGLEIEDKEIEDIPEQIVKMKGRSELENTNETIDVDNLDDGQDTFNEENIADNLGIKSETTNDVSDKELK